MVRIPERSEGGRGDSPSPALSTTAEATRVRATTILAVRHKGRVVIAGDGQVTPRPDGRQAPRAQGAPALRGQGPRRLRRRNRGRADAVREVRGQARAVSRKPEARGRRARQGLAKRPRAAPARGDADRRRSRRFAAHHRQRRRDRARRRRRRRRLGRRLRARGGARARAALEPRCARDRRGSDEATRRRSASTRTTTIVIEELAE